MNDGAKWNQFDYYLESILNLALQSFAGYRICFRN